MLNRLLHHPGLRLLAAIFGTLLCAVGVNLFIVPLGFYTGGLMGFCQILRTLLLSGLNFELGTIDMAGVLYFLINIPILIYAWRLLGRGMALRTLVCTVTSSLFYAIVPIPSAPIMEDPLTACLLGGIFVGVGSGVVLTCSSTVGGLDIVGVCLSHKGVSISVGRFNIGFNAALYAVCLFLFSPEVTIYSVIYNFFAAIVMDRMHQQNVSIQVVIFTHADEVAISQSIIDKLGRGVTYWEGVGAYTGENVHVLCVCLSKYEIEELRQVVRAVDPHAFLVVEEGIRVEGFFFKRQ